MLANASIVQICIQLLYINHIFTLKYMLIFSPDIDRIKSSADRKSNTTINSSGGNFSIKEEAIFQIRL